MLQQDLHVISATVTVPAGESRMEGKARRFTAEEKGKGWESEPQPQPNAEPAASVPKTVQIAETEKMVRPSEPVDDTSTSIMHELQKMKKEMKKLKQGERNKESQTRDSMVPDEANRSMLRLLDESRDINIRASQMPEAGYLHDRLVDDAQLGGGKPPDDSSSDSSDEGGKGKPAGFPKSSKSRSRMPNPMEADECRAM